ncbi:hypothetical protein ES702_07033 [subsurface metagenome]
MSPETKASKRMSISQENIGKIKSFLGIILKEIWLLKRQEDLTMPGQENLRVIGREAGRINELLPGGAK